MQFIGPDELFKAVTGDGTNTVLLIPEAIVNIDDELSASASVLRLTAKDEHRAKS